MKDVYYIKPESQGFDTLRLTGSQLVDMVQVSSAQLKAMRDECYVADPKTEYGLTSNGYKYVTAYKQELLKQKLEDLRYRHKVGQECVDQFHKDLTNSAAKNGHFLNNVRYEREHKGMWFYHVSDLKGTRFRTPPNVPGMAIVRMGLFDGATCKMCNAIMEAKNMLQHQLQKGCFEKEEISKDFVRIDNSHVANMSLVSEIGTIPCKFKPVAYGVYAPAWVQQAVEAFNKNEGYAGMTLVEYLRKIASSQNE